ncbi:MAG: TGS domain-containing protein [Candidatus Aenigmatarchaeota archaeon]|nr:TGS domain-containing protein [Candidatus Aenigmarchaeota archaeon]
MPANLTSEWYEIEKEYREEKDLKKKIELLKRLIAATPKHKGTENLLADLRRRLSKLEELLEKRSKKLGARQVTIKKEGDLLISIVGLTKSGKSTLLKELTNANVDISEQPYTTKNPVTGVCFYSGMLIQFVEIPSFFLPKDLSIVHISDLILILANNEKEREDIEEILEKNRIQKKKIYWKVDFRDSKKQDYKMLLEKIIREADIIRVFTKPLGKQIEKRAVVLKNGSTLRDMIEKINSNWLKTFRFARIFDNSRFSGRRVGLNYKLKDKDIVELHV